MADETERSTTILTGNSGATGDASRVYGGLYPDPRAAEQGIRRFHEAGYPREGIGVITRDPREGQQVAEATGANVAEGAASGLLAGGLIGGLGGLLVGIGALAIPGIGPVIAGGALAGALGSGAGTAVAGAGIGASIGGIIGALTGLGMPRHEAEYYDRGVQSGRTLVTVHDDQGQANNLFDETGADRYREGGTSTTVVV